jgi:hypothetical protein
MGIPGKEGIDLLKEVIPVGVKGEKGIIEVLLKNTVRTIHWAIGDGVDHIVPTADMPGGSWTGFQTPSIKMSNKKISFTDPDGIELRRKVFDQILLVLDYFNRNIREGSQDSLRN